MPTSKNIEGGDEENRLKPVIKNLKNIFHFKIKVAANLPIKD